jgi:hypothetical protein
MHRDRVRSVLSAALLTSLAAGGAVASTACRPKERLACADPPAPTVAMGDKWKTVPLSVPADARVCSSSEREVSVAGHGKGPDVDALLAGFRQQGYVLDEDPEQAAQSSSGIFRVGLRKGLYGLAVSVINTSDYSEYGVEAQRFAPFDGYLKQEKGTLLASIVPTLIRESATKDTDFWKDMRLVFAPETLPVRRDYARADAVARAYEDELSDPKDLLDVLDAARTQGLTKIKQTEINADDDPRLTTLQALAKSALSSTLEIVELYPADAKPNAPASKVLTFALVDGAGCAYLGSMAAFKDGAVTDADLKPRGKTARASTH